MLGTLQAPRQKVLAQIVLTEPKLVNDCRFTNIFPYVFQHVFEFFLRQMLVLFHTSCVFADLHECIEHDFASVPFFL